MSSVQVMRIFQFHCSMPRPPTRRRRRSNPRTRRRTTFSDPSSPSPSDSADYSAADPSKLRAVIDLDLDLNRLSLSLSSHPRLRRLLASADDALADLRTLVAVDPDRRRLVLSCRRSTLQFAAGALLASCALVLGLRALFSLLSRLALGRRSGRAAPVVVRRDRSLGGKEVVVSAGSGPGFRGPSDPLSPPLLASAAAANERVSRNWVRAGKRLPKWWPSSAEIPPSPAAADKEYYQREADRLIRAITDNRMSGKDIVADDIIQLRQICRTSGVRVSFDTTNTRDSFYRTSVDFILNVCARAPSHSSSIQLAGEDARQFIAGLAENIGLENIRAARIVSAAVAARTRSRFLQAWALEMQGKHAEAMLELSKICLTLRIFPPEESSPEMEMVARGLEKHLKLEQRELLMDMLAGFCEEEIRRTAAEALGLMPYSTNVGEQQ